MLQRYKHHLLLHFIVFIWGFTAILGKLITFSPQSIVWWRMLIAVSALVVYALFLRKNLKVSGRRGLSFLGVGVIIALHWICFFRAIKVSNISVTLACLSTGALFASVLEPVFFRRRFNWYELLLGLLVIAGLYMIFTFESGYREGMAYSVLAAFLAALFTVINGLYVKNHDAVVITIYEMLGGLAGVSIFIALSASAPLLPAAYALSDFIYLIVLGVVCTAFAFAASVGVMKTLKPYTVVLAVNMEPVYGILLAWCMFGDDEKMTPGFYLGAAVIIVTLVVNGIIKSRLGATKKLPS